MNSRRNFIKTTATGSAAILFVNPLLAQTMSGKKIPNLGYISGLIGEDLKGDWKAVLKKTADMGYNEIETGKHLGKSAKKFLKYCKSIGIKPVAGGFGYSEDMDEVKKSLDNLLDLKVQYAINYWPWKGGPPFNFDRCKTSAEWLNKAGALAKERGMQFCWHNHDNEFYDMEEGKPFDYLMQNTDDDLVHCELDVHWVHRGGSNPVDVIKQYKGRIPILHLKDMEFDAKPEESFRCPGEGDVDFKAILAEADRQNIKHFFVERDKHPDGISCLETSADYLLKLRY